MLQLMMSKQHGKNAYPNVLYHIFPCTIMMGQTKQYSDQEGCGAEDFLNKPFIYGACVLMTVLLFRLSI